MRIRILFWIACIPAVVLFILFQQIAEAQQAARPAVVGARDESDKLAADQLQHRSIAVAPLPPIPAVQSMIDQVDRELVYQVAGELSGQWPVLLDGQTYTILTRHTYSGQAISNTTRFVGQQMAVSGLEIEYHYWDNLTNPNVIGELTGRRTPEVVHLLSAHLDSTSPVASSLAPGADDNASGSTAVLLIAQILSQYRWDCTLRFALWTGEEQRLRGSQAYAQRAASSEEQIAGVLNLDMIAWNSQGSQPGMDLHASHQISGSLALAQLFSDVVTAYDLALIPEIVPTPTVRSDHASFWQAGYPAILAIEDMADFNPYYHTIQDTVQRLDFDYFSELVRASLGTMVHMNDCLVTGSLNGHVLASGTLTPIAQAQIRAEQPSMPPINFRSNESGYFTVTLPVGVYTATASAIGHKAATVSSTLVVTDALTTTDFFLEARPPVLLPLIALDK